MNKINNYINRIINKIYIIILILFSFSCGENANQVAEENDSSAELVIGTDQISVSTTQFASAEMQLGQLSKQEFYRSIKTNGMFEVPPENRSSVSTYFGGFVKDIRLLPGMTVRKGQLLFTLENPEYLEIQRNFLEVKGTLSYLKSDYERQKTLSDQNVTAKKDFLKAEADYTVASVNYATLKEKLRLMNIPSEQLNQDNLRSTISIYAPQGGNITAVEIRKGMYLTPTDVAITITDNDHLHLELAVFESELKNLAVGQKIVFNVQNDNGNKYEAKIFLVNRNIDTEKRTVEVHGDLVNEKEIESFAVGMYVEAEIYTDLDTSWAIPIDAVVSKGGSHYLYELVSEENSQYLFKPLKVEIGRTTKEYIEISGIENGWESKKILVNGLFQVLKE